MQTSSNWPDFSVMQSPERAIGKSENPQRPLGPSAEARMGRTDEDSSKYAAFSAVKEKPGRLAGLVHWDESAPQEGVGADEKFSGHAAIGAHDLPIYPPAVRSRQERDDARDVIRLAQAFQRRHLGVVLDQLGALAHEE